MTDKLRLDNDDSLLLTETVFLNGCQYELKHIGETRVTFEHVEPIDQHCSEHCRKERALTMEEATKLHV